MLDSGEDGPGFKSQKRRCLVTVLGKLFTPIVPLFTKCEIGSSPLKGCEGNCRPGGNNGGLPPGLWLTSPASWLPSTGISSGTLRSAIEYGLPLLLLLRQYSETNEQYTNDSSLPIIFCGTSWRIGFTQARVISHRMWCRGVTYKTWILCRSTISCKNTSCANGIWQVSSPQWYFNNYYEFT